MIISIEGLDGSGKETTCKELAKLFIEKTDKKVKIISFPDYNLPSAKLIKEVLSGGIANSLPLARRPLFIAELFTINRYEHFKSNAVDLNDPDTVYIMDRYMHSNIFYQCIGLTNDEFEEVAKNIIAKDVSEYGIPYPDYSFYLDVKYPVLCERLNKRNISKSGVSDKYENLDFLKLVFQVANTAMALKEASEGSKRYLFPDYVVHTDDMSAEEIAYKIFNFYLSKEESTPQPNANVNPVNNQTDNEVK